MNVLSTQDISLTSLRDLANELPPEFDIAVVEHQYFFKSAQPPSWVAFVADAPWWLKVLGGYAAIYIAAIVKEAGKTTWKDRAVIAAAVGSAGQSALRTFARTLAKLRTRITPRTQLVLGLPVPDEDLAARLTIESTNQDLCEVQVALFLHHLPKLAELIRSQQLDSKALGPIALRLLPDGSLEVRWMDSDAEQERRYVLHLDAA